MGKLIQLLYPVTVKFRCPNCSSEIPYFDVKIGFGERWTREQFACPACKCLLCVSSAYGWLVFFGTLLVAVMIAVTLGIHPWYFCLLATVLIWAFAGMLAGAYVKVLFPPKIMRYYPDDISSTFKAK